MTKKTKSSIYDDYMSYYDMYSKKYAPKNVVVLMQIGKFYEIYSSGKYGPNLEMLSKELGDLQIAKKDGREEISTINPIFVGFPKSAELKYTNLLIENNYIVVRVDQIENLNKPIKSGEKVPREVTGIFSRGTYIENITQRSAHHLVCIYCCEEPQRDSPPLWCVGLSAIDLSTGKLYVHEEYSTIDDNSFAFDEISRFVTYMDPKEVIIYVNFSTSKIDSTYKDIMKHKILSYIDIDKNMCNYHDNIDQKYMKSSYQKELFKNIFKDSKTIVSPFDYLNINNKIYIHVSLALIIDYVYESNKQLLDNLEKPEMYMDNRHLILGNNAITQLNLINNQLECDSSTKFKNLFDVINNTSTPMGQRLLKSRLLSPLVDAKKLTEIYDIVEKMIDKNNWEKVEKYLNLISDSERLERKSSARILKPYELVSLLNSYENIVKLFEFIRNEKMHKLITKLLPEENDINKIKNMIDDINNTFIIEELKLYTNNYEIETSIFKAGKYKELDELSGDIDCGNEFIENLKDELIKLLDVKTTTKNKIIYTKYNNRDGNYLSMTSAKVKLLKKELERKKTLTINEKTIDLSILKFRDSGVNTKIYLSRTGHKVDDIERYKREIIALNKKYYIEYLASLCSSYSEVMKECSRVVSFIDFIKSVAKTSILYNYTKPIIQKKTYGFISVKKLRHPIIERIIDYEYVPHDVTIGHDDLKGMLVFGINSSGKSSMMKALGISTIMAQAGMFVPAVSFEFSPYNALYARITGNDNILKGQSSFTLEMTELSAILKRADKYTLVIGDEICRGTEHISGNALVASAILHLAESKATFLFATHLHELMTLDEIKELKNVKAYHLKVTHDHKTDTLIFDRTLSEGSGESTYGITVAKYIIRNSKFIDTAFDIKNKLLKTYDSLISGKTSKYNSNIFVYECNLCGKKDEKSHISPLETHHINFQKDCENGFVKDKNHIKKNQEANLIVLCSKCHDKIHNGQIKLSGYKMTSNGKTICIEKDDDDNMEIDDKNKNKKVKKN